MADAFKSHVKIFALNGINKNEDVCSPRQKKKIVQNSMTPSLIINIVDFD